MHAGDASESGNLAGTDSMCASAPIPAFDFASAGASTRVDRDCATNSGLHSQPPTHTSTSYLAERHVVGSNPTAGASHLAVARFSGPI